jgi:flagellar biogenesis protein FliO
MEALQQFVTVLFVLGLMGGTLMWLRHKGTARFTVKSIGRTNNRRLRSIEKLSLTPQHSLHLVTVGGRTLLIAASPGSCSILDGTAWEAPESSPAGRSSGFNMERKDFT